MPGAQYILATAVATGLNGADFQLDVQQPEVHQTLAAANAAARKQLQQHKQALSQGSSEYDHTDEGCFYGTCRDASQYVNIKVCPVNFKASGAAVKVKKELSEDGNEEEEEIGDEAEEDEEQEETKPAAKQPSKKRTVPKLVPRSRKTIPEGKPNALEGLKLLFTGTFEAMDRKTSIATAMKYGAEVITKLEDTDYIVLGLRAGPNKLKVINELELDTLTEDEFFDLLRTGVSKEKRESMAARKAADDAERPQTETESEEEVKPKKKKSRR